MKKYFKKIVSVFIILFTVFAITSCDASRNTKKPTGSLDLNSTYASLASGEKVSVGEVYNLLRNSGYNTVLNEFKKQLFQKEMSKISYQEYKEDYDELIINAIYGVTDVEDYQDLKDDDKEKSIKKFIDNQLTSTGLDFSNIYKTNKEKFIPNIDNDKFVCNWPEDLINQYTYSVALVEYAKEYLKTIIDKETIINVDGDEEDNSYYIDEDVIEKNYNNTKTYTSHADKFGIKYHNQADDANYANHAIVIKYGSYALAHKYVTTDIENRLAQATTKEEVLDIYMQLFNSYYKDKTKITAGNLYSNENSSFVINKDENEFSNLGSDVTTFITDNLKDLYSDEEGTSYLTKPFNLAGDNCYYMILRINVYEGKDYDDLSDAQKETIKDVVIENCIDGWATESYGNTLVENRLKSSNLSLRIYDPVYENQFANTYKDYYDFTKKFDNNLVFSFEYTYDDDAFEFAGQTITGQYSVDDCYEKLNSMNGASNAVTLLSSKYLLNCTTLLSDIDSDAIDGYNDGIKDAIKSFKRNETNYSKKMGIKNYLVLTYGYETQEEIVNYKLIASNLTSLFNSFYGYFDGNTIAETNAVAGGKTAFADNGLFAALKVFTDNIYENYYSVDIAHLLIAIDSDLDGNYEDPKKYMDNLSESDLALFKTDILTLADALVREAKVITADRKNALSFLATSFNNQGYRYVLQNERYYGKTWSDFTKNFEFAIKYEDLSTISNSNGSSYVEEFTDEVKSLYNTLVSDAYSDILADIEDNGYWKYDDTITGNVGVDTTNTDLASQLTQTTYGWHMLYAYDLTEKSSCKFTEANDSTLSGITKVEGDTEEKYGTWEYQDIVVYSHDTDTTDDDYVIYASGYSDDEKASIEQLFIYFIEYLNNGSVTSMRSSTSTAVGKYFSSVITRYTSSNFQKYRLYKQLGTITFTDEEYASRYQLSLDILERTMDDYKELDSSDDFYGWFTKDWTVKGLR